MKYIDWFAGVGGFRLGLARAGHECVGSCEINPRARKVYTARFGAPEWFPPDITEVKSGDIPEADLWCGGSPCQGFSSAGARRGLDDSRSKLLATWVSLAAERRPRWLLLENVDALLTIHGGADFGAFLATLDDIGYVGAWAVLDARWFGVAQRRRRVYVLARLPGDGPHPAEVLALAESGGRDCAARGEARSVTAGRAPNGAGTVGALGAGGANGRAWRLGSDEAAAGHAVVNALTASGSTRGGRHGKDLIGTLSAGDGGADDNDARQGRLVASALTASMGHHGRSSPRGDPGDNLIVARALTTRQTRHQTEDTFVLQCGGGNVGPMGALRRGNGHVTGGVPVVGFSVKGSAQGGAWHATETETAAALTAKGAKPTGNEAGTIIAFDPTQHPVSSDQVVPTLQRAARDGSGGPFGVRRLTPTECERLMGLPDGHTCLCGCASYSTEA